MYSLKEYIKFYHYILQKFSGTMYEWLPIYLTQSKILSPVEKSMNTTELKIHKRPGITNTGLQLSGLEMS